MDLLWNSDPVENITTAVKKTKVQGNSGSLAVTHKAEVLGYRQDVWSRKYSITNIIALKHLLEQYQVTYESIGQIFVVHREDQEKTKHGNQDAWFWASLL